MKLTLRFFYNEMIVCCEQKWSNLDTSLVSYFSSNSINQELDDFIKYSSDLEKVEHEGTSYIKLNSNEFSYEIRPKFKQHIGSYYSLSLNMPYANENEFFMGDSCILRPFSANFEEDFYDNIDLDVINETDLEFYSSLDDKTDKKQLLLFFCYLIKSEENYFKGNSSGLEIEVIQSPRASRIISAKELFEEVNRYHKYYLSELGEHKQKRLLIFQSLPDSDFKILAKGKTLATGENVRNGILIYLPDDPDYIEILSGHRSYTREVKIGLLHELGHFYSSKGGDPSKTIISHAKNCPERDYWIVGENLNGYFTTIIAKKLGLISDLTDFSSLIKKNSDNYRKRKGFAGILYFTYVDKILHENGSSLWEVYKHMINVQRKRPYLYESLDYFINSCKDFCDSNTINKIRELFNKQPEDLLI